MSPGKVIEGAATQSANCFPRDRLVCAARVYCICSQQLYTSVSQAYINLLLSFTCCLSSSGWLYWDVYCLSGEEDMNIDDVIPPPSLAICNVEQRRLGEESAGPLQFCNVTGRRLRGNITATTE